MRHYLILGSRITVHAQAPAVIPPKAIHVQAPKDLDPKRFPLSRLVELHNAIPGIDPVKRFKDRKAGITRVWSALESLPIGFRRTDSKQARVVALLSRPAGASLDDLMIATGWQAHSVRGVLSGVLRKKLGLALTSKLDGDTRIYRIGA